uniref:Uncharacterized protein n=1 Tax=Solanum lycopersicum TaxID=4081 RepID=A0A3Q7IIG2_SOLLC
MGETLTERGSTTATGNQSQRLRGKVLHIGRAAFFISLALSPTSAFRLGSALGVRLDRLSFFRLSKAVNVSAILPSLNLSILCFFPSLFQFST